MTHNIFNYMHLCLRTVFDGNEPTLFCERLDIRIKSHDQEIERMCNHHYQGFIESIRGLLQVRSDVENLKVIFFGIIYNIIIKKNKNSIHNFT